MDERDVASFWRWFAQACGAETRALSPDLADELDRRVLRLGDFAWEVGPGRARPLALTISAGGDRELIASAEAIISAAPVLDNWELHTWKQPKEWSYRFRLPATAGRRDVDVDARLWRYVILRYPDGAHELFLELPCSAAWTPEMRILAAEIAVDSAIGEEARVRRFDLIDAVDRFDEDHARSARPFTELADHLVDAIGANGQRR